MKLSIEIAGRSHVLEFDRDGRSLAATIDGRSVEADALEVSPGIYSILMDGAAFEAHVETVASGLAITIAGRSFPARVIDRRQWQGRRGHALEAEGRQQVAAPMPGKVVRILVQQGEKVEAGQGILVVEAMKMQNEIRSPKTGTLERLLVSDGQAVNAGEVVAVVA